MQNLMNNFLNGYIFGAVIISLYILSIYFGNYLKCKELFDKTYISLIFSILLVGMGIITGALLSGETSNSWMSIATIGIFCGISLGIGYPYTKLKNLIISLMVLWTVVGYVFMGGIYGAVVGILMGILSLIIGIIPMFCMCKIIISTILVPKADGKCNKGLDLIENGKFDEGIIELVKALYLLKNYNDESKPYDENLAEKIFLLTENIEDINKVGKDVFKVRSLKNKYLFLGPRSSGKTVLAIGLYNIITRVFGGSAKGPVDLWATENIPSLMDLHSEFEGGGYNNIGSTLIFAVHYLIIRKLPNTLKKYGISEAIMELVDYRGEYIETVSNLIKNRSKLEQYLMNLEDELIDNNIEESIVHLIIDDLKNYKFKDFENYLPREVWKKLDVNLVGPLYLLSRIKSSNSLIFLVDGKKLLDYLVDRNPTLSIIRDSDKEFYEKIKSEKTVEQNILKDLSNYATIVSCLDDDQKIFFAITKSDVIADAFQRAMELPGEFNNENENEDIVDYEDIKDSVINTLLENPTMNAIINDKFGANIDKEEIKNQIYVVSVRPNEEPKGIVELINGVLSR